MRAAGLLLAVALQATTSAAWAVARPTVGRSGWRTRTQAPRGVALVVHGLNQRPGEMGALTALLARRGVDGYGVVLSGHDGDRKAYARSSRAAYLADVRRGYEQASARARSLGVPLYLAGFSIGALLGVDLARHAPDVRFDKMLLFSPAFQTRGSRVLGWLSRLVPKLWLPSFSPASRRAHRWTPMSAYRAMYESAEAVGTTGLAGLGTPALVFSDPRDKLVPHQALRQLVDEQDGWRLVPVDARGPLAKRTQHHLVTSPDGVGAEQWGVMEQQIARFLATP